MGIRWPQESHGMHHQALWGHSDSGVPAAWAQCHTSLQPPVFQSTGISGLLPSLRSCPQGPVYSWLSLERQEEVVYSLSEPPCPASDRWIRPSCDPCWEMWTMGSFLTFPAGLGWRVAPRPASQMGPLPQPHPLCEAWLGAELVQPWVIHDQFLQGRGLTYSALSFIFLTQ